MFFRKCRICAASMDPGDGVNGVCEDCISEKAKQQYKTEQNCEQLEMMDFLEKLERGQKDER